MRLPLTDGAFRRGALLIAVVAGLHGLLYVPLVHKNTATDSATYVASAKAILHGGYSTPLKAGFYYVYPIGFFDLTGARLPRVTWQALERQTFRPPGYPLYLTLFGDAGGGVPQALALVGQAALFAAGAFLLALTVRRWWGPGLGLGAEALYALDPWSKHYVALILSETVAALVALAGVYAFTRAYQERAHAWWAATGALAAALTLVRAVFVFTVPLVVIAALLRRGSGRRRLVDGGAALACAAVLLAPWLGWTSWALGKPVLASYGEGFNLLVAAHGEGYGKSFTAVSVEPAFQRDVHAVYRFLPTRDRLLADPSAHPRYLERADRTMRHEAWSLLRQRLRHEPLQVGWEILYRAWYLWAAHEDWYQPSGAALDLLAALDWVTIALGLVGAALALGRGGAARAVAVLLLVYTAVIATHHVEARFAMPLRGLLLAFVAYALAEALRLGRRLRRTA
jgi:hypothetical protein